MFQGRRLAGRQAPGDGWEQRAPPTRSGAAGLLVSERVMLGARLPSTGGPGCPAQQQHWLPGLSDGLRPFRGSCTCVSALTSFCSHLLPAGPCPLPLPGGHSGLKLILLFHYRCSYLHFPDLTQKPRRTSVRAFRGTPRGNRPLSMRRSPLPLPGTSRFPISSLLICCSFRGKRTTQHNHPRAEDIQ